MSEDVLRAEGVGYSYSDGRTALSGVSIGCMEGSKVAFVGPNGAGKSTLLLMFNAILRPKVGAVLYRGSPLRYDTASLREIRRKVGVVLQNPDDQLFAPTVYLDVAFGPTNLDLPSDKVARYVDYALSYVGLEGYEDRTPHHLSGGEKKRVAIAGILAMEPEVMILDEPTSNLDPASSEEIMEMLDELNVYGKTVIISTHDVELAYRWADHVVLMNGGAVLREGPPESVFSDGPSIKKARLKRPMLLDLREELVGRGIMDEENELPKSILDMVDMIHRTVGSITKVSTGRIFLYPIDEGDPSELSALLEGDQVSFIGAMGTKAKIMAGKQDLKLDFSYGVIDKCILKAITGRNSLIMTSGGMVDHTVGRIREYGGELGVELKIMRPAGKDGATTDDPATKPQH